MDAIDAVLMSVHDNDYTVMEHVSSPISATTRKELLSLCEPGSNEIQRLGEMDVRFGHEIADTIIKLLEKASISSSRIKAIGSHGQTVRHCPDAPNPFSLQLGNASIIAHKTGITTINDFRMADMAAGGQGAPLVPAFHAAVFSSREASRALVNLGGIANLTFLDKSGKKHIQGYDTGPANTLLDRWISIHKNAHYDEEGMWARTGSLQASLLEELCSDPYLERLPPKSTGREYYNQSWLDKFIPHADQFHPEDIQRTLLEFTAKTVADALSKLPCREIYLCGGGARNTFLVERLQARLPDKAINTSATLGIDPQLVEPCAFAWLAHQTLKQLTGNQPSATGASRPKILGGIYPAS